MTAELWAALAVVCGIGSLTLFGLAAVGYRRMRAAAKAAAADLARLERIADRGKCRCEQCDEVDDASEFALIDGRLLCGECEDRFESYARAADVADRYADLGMERMREAC